MNLAENLINNSKNFPNKIAIRFQNQQITYSELTQKVLRLSDSFSQLGLKKGSRVGVILLNSPEFVITYYALLAVGCEIITLNPLYTPHELNYILNDAQVECVITSILFKDNIETAIKMQNAKCKMQNGKKHSESTMEIQNTELALKLILSDATDPKCENITNLINKGSDKFKLIDTLPTDTAVIIYTNAVNGYPMGAMLTHEGLDFDAEAAAQTVNILSEDVFLGIIPFFHGFAATGCMNLPIKCGATMVLQSTFISDQVIKSLQADNITIFPAVPAIFVRLTKDFGNASPPQCFQSVRAYVSGGAPIPDSAVEAFESAFNGTIFEGYGITECGPVTTVNPFIKEKRKIGSIGLPLKGIEVEIEHRTQSTEYRTQRQWTVDSQQVETPNLGVCTIENYQITKSPSAISHQISAVSNNQQSTSVQGEVIVKGKNVMKGYLNNPEATAEAILSGWFHTGDIGFKDEDGYVFLTGRCKRLIIVNGFNVYSAEVERILRQHPSVADCEVVGVQDELTGERVSAKITLKNKDASVQKTEITRFCRNYLAPYKAPRFIEFI